MSSGVRVRLSAFLVVIHFLIIAGQECRDTVGSLNHDNDIVTVDYTFIFADYIVQCRGTVVAWEFCYQMSGASVVFYPGIWTTNGNSNTDYALVQSSTVTYDQSVRDPQDPTNLRPCQIFSLSDTDQFTAPAGSVVGLFSNVGTQLLHTSTNSSITTYRFRGNQSSVNNAGNNDDINYNIAIRVHLDRQKCIDAVNVRQRGTNAAPTNRQVIVPRSTFSCNGRITGYLISLESASSSGSYPIVQVWHPTSSNIFTRVNTECPLTNNESDISRMTAMGDEYHLGNVTCIGDNRIEFESGDIIGYYQSNEVLYLVWNIITTGYTSYFRDEGSPPNMFSTNTESDVTETWQPLIQVIYDIRCDDLSAPANGKIMSCSSGRVGVGYEGDNCSFTCNTGYELTSSDTRTCQSNGSWSGSEVMCRRGVQCSSLSDPNNGTMNCLLGDDGIPFYEDTCNFTCNTGYELTGSDTRTCQSDGSWSGTNSTCERVQCPILVDEILQCPNGATTGVFEDTCTFSCSAGYELQGPNNRTCLANKSWNGGLPICVPLSCSNRTEMLPPGSILSSTCDELQYQSQCNLSCDEGFTGDNVTYLCNVTSNVTMVEWIPIGRIDVMCKRVHCPAPVNGTLQCPNGTTGVFEDNCTFSCNAGFGLQGSSTTGTCLANQSWSRGDPICVALNCSDVTMLANNTVTSSSCNMTYQSQCTVSCDEGFTGDDVTYLCNLTSGPTMVDWVPIGGVNVMCKKVQCPTPMNGTLQCPNGTTGGFEDTCTFSCNAGYELQGPNNRTCLANKSWSGRLPICVPLSCSNRTEMLPSGSILSSTCDELQYQSQCNLSCDEGFTGDNVTYLCNVTSNVTMVEWIPIGGIDVMCKRVHCPAPVNGTLQCPNGTTGVFEDNCTFSCNAGFGLQGSSTTGTCLANQSWSGGDPICVALNCSDVTMLANNTVTSSSCNMTYQSQCTVSCDEGFTGDDVTYLCNVTNNATMVDWMPMEGVSVMCKRVQCPPLINGDLQCSNGSTTGVFEDTCTFSCNAGYELQGSNNGTCLANQSWSGGLTSCVPLNCRNRSRMLPFGSMLLSSCNLTYQSQCTVSCDEGFTGNDVTYLCNVTSHPTMVDWVPIGGVNVMCKKVQCPTPMNGTLQCPNGTTGGFEDTCTFSCNAGYELQGSNNRTCLVNQSWSGEDPICVALNCSTSPPLNNSQLQSPCDTQYQSTCTTVCVDGYTGVGGSYTCVVTDEDTNSVGWNGSTSCQRVPTSDATTVSPTTSIVSTSDTTTVVNPTAAKGAKSDSGGGSSIGIIAGAVVGVILCIIVLLVVVILLWRFSRRRKEKVNIPQKAQNLELVSGKCNMYQESTDSHYYSSAESQPNVKNNGDFVYKNVASEYEVLSEPSSCKNVKKSDDLSPYSDSTGKNHSRFACNDYEVAPKTAEYETAIQFYSNTMKESTAYDASRMSEYSEVADAITASDGEEIYSDPGHCKEDIYACFEKKKFRIIKRNDVSIFQELGSGEFGVVHLGTWTDVCSDPVQVAVKTLNSQCSESDRIKFLREAAIMGQFKHDNVVQLHGVVTEEENMMIVLEFMPKGDLQEFLIKLKNTTPPEAFNELKHDLLSYCRHVSAGLSHLASKGFVHRDLAARNILVSSDDVCKIADFGMARDVTDDTYYVSSGGKVPLKWTAPEAIFYKKYSIQSDVWSFGCVMYEIWSLGYKPFEDLGGIEYVRKITTGYRLPPPPGCPRAIYELMIKCWHPVANKRIDSCSLNKALQKSDRALLPGAVSAKDNEELSTGLGDPLASSSHLYQNLQNIYLSTIKL